MTATAGSGLNAYVGGLVGALETGTVSNSYATGNVSAVTGSLYAGGLAGTNSGNISNSYATGTVSGTTNVGGLVGANYSSITNSHWNSDIKATGIGAGTITGATGLTTAQMQLQSNFSSWDFANSWVMYDTHTNPLLRVFMTPLTVTSSSAAKTYDGLAYSGGTASYSCCKPADVLGTVSFSNSPSEGAINANSYAMAPSGLWSNQQGYIIGYVDGTLTVNKAPLSVTANAVTKIYDASLTATGTGTVGVIAGAGAGEAVLSAGSQTFLDKNVGNGNKTVQALGVTIQNASSVDVSSNYLITYTDNLTSTITAKALVATGLVSVNKVYNTTLLDALSGAAVLANGASADGDGKYYTGDTVNVTGTAAGAFADKNVGTAKTVAITGLGVDNTNYTVSHANTSADITAKALVATGLVGVNKVYNTTLVDALSGAAVLANGASADGDGKYYMGDTVGLTGSAAGAFADKNVGTAKTVAITGLGVDNSNYTVSHANTAANITAATLPVTGIAAANKVYDTTTAATLVGSAVVAPLASDLVNVGGTGSGVFVDPNVGAGKVVIASGYTLTGTDAGNYTVMQPTGLTANISAVPVVIVEPPANPPAPQQEPVISEPTQLASNVFSPKAETRPDALHLLPTITVTQSLSAAPVAADSTTAPERSSNTVVNTMMTIGGGMGPSLQIVSGGINLPTNMVNVNE